MVNVLQKRRDFRVETGRIGISRLHAQRPGRQLSPRPLAISEALSCQRTNSLAQISRRFNSTLDIRQVKIRIFLLT